MHFILYVFQNSNICDMRRVGSLRKIIHMLRSIKWKDALKLTKMLKVYWKRKKHGYLTKVTNNIFLKN